ncbi:MAG TPA: type II toxin-antitoxin system RelE/ParE family toxin [Pelagibacterium sp.]|uniref:type II toxin-antitoxin system RelE/ParE family toxin n=1 Tax=Pelagibacterium sp. TaxID=1967288 RepID=UPI002B8CEC8E|nr:type II toxin-antitoxin system RelE/ParE family toxin [Pelagibacterium sp.]HWJ88913.1 type II toxin-antitoxin system RelE/ParE family toxin [Pelagibacterium sp.]
MGRTIWSPQSQLQLQSIFNFIASDDPRSAESVARRLVAAGERLAVLPTGRPGRIAGTFEKLVRGLPYFIIYSVRGDEIHILQLIHTAQNFPPR